VDLVVVPDEYLRSALLQPTFRTLNCHTRNFGCLEILMQAIAYGTSEADLLAAALALSHN